MQKDKYIKQAPHSYNIPSSLEAKKGNAFHGGRYVSSFLLRKLEATLAGKKSSTPHPVPSSIASPIASIK